MEEYIAMLYTLITSLIAASLATMPYVMYIFNRISWHLSEANLLVIPFNGFLDYARAVAVILPAFWVG